MKVIIGKQTLGKLAELARIKIKNETEEKLLGDIEKILEHFDELKEVDISGVEPMAGAVELTNVFREDKKIKCETSAIDLISAFPEKEGDFLKVPGVFE
jgi:aspartyl-tRNA(Asn)/glutamyl-tRNA(Gln) amidotransferase subunit C